jgi:hypothetical protein
MYGMRNFACKIVSYLEIDIQFTIDHSPQDLEMLR